MTTIYAAVVEIGTLAEWAAVLVGGVGAVVGCLGAPVGAAGAAAAWVAAQSAERAARANLEIQRQDAHDRLFPDFIRRAHAELVELVEGDGGHRQIEVRAVNDTGRTYYVRSDLMWSEMTDEKNVRISSKPGIVTLCQPGMDAGGLSMWANSVRRFSDSTILMHAWPASGPVADDATARGLDEAPSWMAWWCPCGTSQHGKPDGSTPPHWSATVKTVAMTERRNTID